MESLQDCYEPSSLDGALRQGEIVTDLIQRRLNLDTVDSERPKFDKVLHPYAIVVSQDCDLAFDFQTRKECDFDITQQEEVKFHKLIPSVLFCQATTAESLRSFGREQGTIKNRDAWNIVVNNTHERYHFLEAVHPENDALHEGLPAIGIDFKRLFTIPTDELYNRLTVAEFQRRCRLVSPYLEHFCTRYSYFQSRIGVPRQYIHSVQTT